MPSPAGRDVAAREQLLHQPGATEAAFKLVDAARRPRAQDRSSSPTQVPRPSSARSSWRASTADAGGSRSVRPSAASTTARSPRWQRPVSRRSTSRSSRCPRLSSCGVGRPRRVRAAVDAPPRPCSSSRSRARGGVNPAPDGYLAGASARSATRRRTDDGRRDPDRVRRTGRWFGFEHDGCARRRDAGQGDGQRHAGRCVLGRDVAAVFEPGDHGSTYSGTAIATAAVSP